MEFEELNSYLTKLEGPALIKNIHIDDDSNIDELVIKVLGDTGTIDDGEIELVFLGVEVINIPQGFMTPISIRMASRDETVRVLNTNYIESSCNLYMIQDGEGILWHVYAESYKVTILPVFYGQ